jgi:deazaflavin-dependent oxidoreductase (nitroreductase family)
VGQASKRQAIRKPGPFARGMIRAVGRVHRFLYRRGVGRQMGQLQQVLLTTTGRKSGKPHTVPLGGVPEGDGWIVIGSYGGADVHPSWWLNLVANPLARLQVGDRVLNVRMQEITDPAERQRIWANVVAHNKGYAGYEQKTSRVIPLGWLRPIN